MTQEHHVFLGTIRDNVRAGPAGRHRRRRRSRRSTRSTRWTGCRSCRTAWTPRSGTGGHGLSPAQAQQLALARLVLADPHTLVLDEATSLIDPRAARHLERSLAAVLDGRTVIAIAHRLHTAHDADRVAVVEDGRITELGIARRAGRGRRLVRRAVGVVARHRAARPPLPTAVRYPRSGRGWTAPGINGYADHAADVPARSHAGPTRSARDGCAVQKPSGGRSYR